MINMTTKQARALLIFTFIFLSLLYFFKTYPPSARNSFSGLSPARHDFAGIPLVTKVTMLYGDDPNPHYVRALRSHREHNHRWNYGMEVLQQDITGGYWNKPSYLISLLVRELAKSPEERTQWLMWVDADLIIVNPSVPLSIFLPPSQFPNVCFLGNRDHKGINTGAFFLRVHPWSLTMLAKSIALPMYIPDVDLDVSVDQSAMGVVMNESDFYDQGQTLFQPREWYNAYEFRDHYEGVRGDLLVHFPGLEAERWQHMENWLDIVERQPALNDVPLQETRYPAEVNSYWESVAESYEMLAKAQEFAKGSSRSAQAVAEGADALERVMHGTELQTPPGTSLLATYKERIDFLKKFMDLT